jgi:hypothetical protein
MSGFPLTDGSAINGDPMRSHILDLEADDIAASELAVDGKIEHGKIAGVVTLSEIGQIWTINQQAKSLKSLASTLAIVGKFRSV